MARIEGHAGPARGGENPAPVRVGAVHGGLHQQRIRDGPGDAPGIFFRFGDYHHDIAVFKTGDDADLPKANQVGLVHVALVTDGVQTVKAMYERCKEMGVEIVGSNDHAITKSLYIKDPEGNTIEIYAEVPEYNWREEGMGFISRPFDIEKVPAPAPA